MKKLFAFTILIGLFSLFSNAEEVRYNDSWSKQGFSLVNSEQSGLDLKYSVNSFAYVDVDVVSCELTSNADCISGNPATSNTLEMSVNLYPAALETPEGPDQLDVYETPSSTYTTAEEPNTMEYHWSVSPENAWEELSSDMNSLTVTWATDFKGQATINVFGTNDCGDGELSGNFEVAVQNTFGIVENDLGIGISVFPNPNNGNFTVKLSSDNNNTIRMQIRNVVGESVYSEENINVNGEFVKTIDFSKYAEGIYFLVIESGNKVATEKIVVQK